LSLFHRPYRFYYGWVIVAASFLTVFFVVGTRSSLGLFYTAILADYGWGRAETAGAFSLMMIMHAVMSPVSGILIDRIGPRKLFPIGGIVFGIGLILSSLISEIWHLYLYLGLITALGVTPQTFAPQMSRIPRWFVRKKGLASGLVLSGMGTGTLFMAIVIGFLITTEGWRFAFGILSVSIFCFVVPINVIFQRNDPEDVGQTIEQTGVIQKRKDAPYEGKTEKQNETPSPQKMWTFNVVLRTKAFWCFFFIGLTHGIFSHTIIVHLAPHIMDLGFNPMFAAIMVGSVGLLGSVGTIVFGSLSDRMGRESGYFVASAGASLGILSLLVADSSSLKWLLYVFVIMYGLGNGGLLSILAAATGDIFSGNALGRILSTQGISFGVGSALGAYFGGYFFDQTGSYTIPFIVVLLSIIASAVAFWIAAPRKPRV
jgi:MFS family permease